MSDNSPRAPRLYLQVADRILAIIDKERLASGERLPSERDLAALLDVSRPTVREAMIALEIAGLVEIRLGSGVYVAVGGGARFALPDQGPGPFEILEARRIIEGATCALAAVRISAAQRDELEQLLAEMTRENLREDMTEAADEKFHCTVAAAAGNSALIASVHWLWKLRNDSEISIRFHQRVREEGNRPIIADHRAIFDALVAGDAAAAQTAMENHLDRVVSTLLEES